MTKMQKKLQDRIIPMFVTVVLHGGILLALMLHWQPEPKPFKAKTPRYVNATLVKVKAQSMAGKLKPATKPKPKVKPTPQAKPKPVVAPKPDLEAIKKAEEKAKKKAADLKAKKAKDLKAKKAADLKAKKAKDLKAQQQKQVQREQALLDAVANEENYEQASNDQELAASYMSVIQERVESNWSRPPSARNDMEVLLFITLVPTGEVVGVEVERSSGSSAFDQSAVRAVRKAEQFAELQELPPRVFEQNYRNFHLLFKPEDLRL